jgi:hypothetical protein
MIYRKLLSVPVPVYHEYSKNNRHFLIKNTIIIGKLKIYHNRQNTEFGIRIVN